MAWMAQIALTIAYHIVPNANPHTAMIVMESVRCRGRGMGARKAGALFSMGLEACTERRSTAQLYAPFVSESPELLCSTVLPAPSPVGCRLLRFLRVVRLITRLLGNAVSASMLIEVGCRYKGFALHEERASHVVCLPVFEINLCRPACVCSRPTCAGCAPNQ